MSAWPEHLLDDSLAHAAVDRVGRERVLAPLVESQLNGRDTSLSFGPMPVGRLTLYCRGTVGARQARKSRGMPGDLHDEPDYTLSVSGTRNEQSSMALAIIFAAPRSALSTGGGIAPSVLSGRFRTAS